MAYITKEEVKIIRDDLKKVFPSKDGWVFSVVKDSSSAVRVKVMKSPIFHGQDFLPTKESFYRQGEDNWTEEQKVVGSIITSIVKFNWWDESDAQVDYFNTAFYYTLGIGKWDKDCEKTPSGWSLEDSTKRFKFLESGNTGVSKSRRR